MNIKLKSYFFFIILIILFCGCSPKIFKAHWIQQKAPSIFYVQFQTSKGVFEVEINRKSSPMAVDRFYQQVRHHFYDNALFYRVVPKFVAQFGTSDTVKQSSWSKFKIPDEKVIQGNRKGALSYARAGVETRGTELFFNLQDNRRLDSVEYNGVKGFPAFGMIVNGIEVLDSIYSGYSETSARDLDTLYKDRNDYIKKFPKLDSIKKATLRRHY